MSSSKKRERPVKRCAPVHVGFAAGVLFALVVYFIFQQQAAISGNNLLRS
jgi:hypothetical protein